MLRVRLLDDGQLVLGGAELLDRPGVKWIDVLEATEEVLELLRERYHLHRLAIEDVMHLDQRPKLEEYPDHQFIVLQGFSREDAGAELVMHEMHFFLGDSWVITAHSQDHPAIAKVAARVDTDPTATLGRGPDFLVYLIADDMVDLHFPLLDQFSEALEDIEEQSFSDPSSTLMRKAFALKRTLVQVRRVLSPQRDVVGLLARSGVKHVQDRTIPYFRDVYDHLVRVYEQIDAARDLVANVMEVYLSVMANRTNEITKQLTIFASLFLPLSFVVGFFGQNFAALSQPWLIFVMAALVISIPVFMFAWFAKRRWL